jgi:autophagy-related protein 11
VFNKYYLDEDFDQVLRLLHLQPPLQPPIEGNAPHFDAPANPRDPPRTETITATPPFKPAQLGASYHRAALAHQQSIARTLESMRCQHSALRIASTVLDLNVLNVADVFDGVAAGAQRELGKQATLIASVDADLEMASRVQIHREFMSSAVQRAIDAGSRPRTLGDYVSAEKMRHVAETCRKTHGSSFFFFYSFLERAPVLHVRTADLRERFHDIEASMKRLSDGAAEVRSSLSDTRYQSRRYMLDTLSLTKVC